jgi:hypothetical protein
VEHRKGVAFGIAIDEEVRVEGEDKEGTSTIHIERSGVRVRSAGVAGSGRARDR